MDEKQLCISVMEELKKEYLQLVEKEKELIKVCEQMEQKHDYNNRKKEVVIAYQNLRSNQFDQSKKIESIGRTFIVMYK